MPKCYYALMVTTGRVSKGCMEEWMSGWSASPTAERECKADSRSWLVYMNGPCREVEGAVRSHTRCGITMLLALSFKDTRFLEYSH